MVKSIPTALAFDERHDNAAFKTPVNFQTDPDPVTLSPKLWNWYFESQETTCIWDLVITTLLSLLLRLVFAKMCSNNVGQIELLYTLNLLMANSSHCKWWRAEPYLGTLDTSRPRQNGRHFPSKCIFVNEKIDISIKTSLRLFPMVQLTIFQHWCR